MSGTSSMRLTEYSLRGLEKRSGSQRGLDDKSVAERSISYMQQRQSTASVGSRTRAMKARGAKTNAGIMEISSNLRANIAFISPPKANTMDVKTTTLTVMKIFAIFTSVKNRAIKVTTAPTIRPRNTPPATWPRMIAQVGIGATSISSRCRWNLAPKNEDTTFP